MKRRIIIMLFIFSCASMKSFCQWKEIMNDSNYFWLSDVKFINKDTGYVCGSWNKSPYWGMILKTTNGGASWDTSQLCCFWMMSLSVINPDTIYATGQDAVIFKSFDGGNQWNMDGSIPCCSDISSNYYLNKDTGFAFSVTGYLWRTFNGSNWAQINLNGQANFPNTTSMQFINDSTGYAAFGKVFKTTDYGTSWQKLNVDSNLKATSIYMKNPAEGIVVGLKGMISLTFDSGITWMKTDTITSGLNNDVSLFDVAFVNDSVGYIAGGMPYIGGYGTLLNLGKIFVTNDKGITWSLMQTFDGALTSLHFVNDSTGYAVGQAGRILKITNANRVNVPELDFRNLITVFPNPFNAITTILINGSKSRHYLLTIYDMLGKKIREEEYNDNVLPFNREKLSSGLYIYRLANDKGQMATGKLLIE